MMTNLDLREQFEQAKQLFELGQYESAFAILDQLVEVEFVPAMTLMASAYSLGLGERLDGLQAVALYQKAAALGDGLAAHNLGTLMLSGMPGVERDLDRARELFRMARRLGCALMPTELYEGAEPIKE